MCASSYGIHPTPGAGPAADARSAGNCRPTIKPGHRLPQRPFAAGPTHTRPRNFGPAAAPAAGQGRFDAGMFSVLDASVSRRSHGSAGTPWPELQLRLRVPVPSGITIPRTLYSHVRRSLVTVRAVLSPNVSPRSKLGGGQAGSPRSAGWSHWRGPFSSGGPLSPTITSYVVSESQRVWASGLQSLQALGRQASRMLRTSSWAGHLAGAAASAEELQQAVDAGSVPESAAPSLQQFQASLSRWGRRWQPSAQSHRWGGGWARVRAWGRGTRVGGGSGARQQPPRAASHDHATSAAPLTPAPPLPSHPVGS
jgi:hypothetical protein